MASDLSSGFSLGISLDGCKLSFQTDLNYMAVVDRDDIRILTIRIIDWIIKKIEIRIFFPDIRISMDNLGIESCTKRD